MCWSLFMLKYKFSFDFEFLSSPISLLLSLESSFWNSTLYFLLSFLSLIYSKPLQAKVTSSQLRCHLFSKTFPNPSTYNPNLLQFKTALCFTPGRSHPLSWFVCLHRAHQLLTHHAIHFSIPSFASSDEKTNSMRGGTFVYLASANIFDVNKYLPNE